ncbi:hypothetical protein BCR44DRAFT_1436025 [Catenaria anguillulae PL171]|uniref:Uncharacterized protein n=1 Tax=Catenaria anguillulae PL171 TaxID=765915 RepID=A0A1Y2HLM1_9FUNG|nr:hypothetical protein BCR44DRAFT_1436025 [Catenaria anguillulae PL171]
MDSTSLSPSLSARAVTGSSDAAAVPPRQPSSPSTSSPKPKGKNKNKHKDVVQTSKALLASEFTPDSSSPAILTSATTAPRAKPAIMPFAPNSSLLSRLDAFLPQLQQANTSLFAAMAKEDGEEERKRKFDIESVTPGQDRVIEMKLGLGLFEARNPSSHEDVLPLPSGGPVSAPPAISFRGPRIYSAGDMDVDTSSSDQDDDEDDSQDDSDDDRMSGEEEAIMAESLQDMVMRFYNEPLGEGGSGEDEDDEDQDADDSDEEHEGSGTRTPLVQEMMEGVERRHRVPNGEYLFVPLGSMVDLSKSSRPSDLGKG